MIMKKMRLLKAMILQTLCVSIASCSLDFATGPNIPNIPLDGDVPPSQNDGDRFDEIVENTILVNGEPYTDTTMLKIADMSIYTMYILGAVAAVATIINMTGIFKK